LPLNPTAFYTDVKPITKIKRGGYLPFA
jgi:hypothetical protein